MNRSAAGPAVAEGVPSASPVRRAPFRMFRNASAFALLVLCLYYVVWHVFVLATRVVLWAYQMAQFGNEYVPSGFQSIFNLDSRWRAMLPAWLVWTIGVPVVCALAVSCYRLAVRRGPGPVSGGPEDRGDSDRRGHKERRERERAV